MGKEVDTNGFWRIKDNPLSKEGVFPYLGKQIDAKLEPNKIYWVYRPMSELSKPETVESFNAVPMIDEHEMIGEGWTPYDDRPAGGVIYNTQAKDGKLYGDIRIFSEKLKEEIESGKKELSMGYECSYEPEHGIFEGKEYDFVQRNLRGNHVALVNRGRMGSDVRVYDHYTFDTLEGLGEFENMAQDNHWEQQERDKSNGRWVKEGDVSSEEHIIEITGNELGEYSDIKDLREKAKEYYKEHYQGKTIEREGLGIVNFSGKGRNETIYGSQENKLKLVPAIGDIIKYGTIGKEEAPKHERKDGIVAFIPITSKVKIGNKTLDTGVLLGKDSQGKLYYDLFIEKKTRYPESLSGAGFDDNITQDEYDVNIYLSGGDETMTENDISAMDREWNEADHPRDKEGKFTDGSGSNSSQSDNVDSKIRNYLEYKITGWYKDAKLDYDVDGKFLGVKKDGDNLKILWEEEGKKLYTIIPYYKDYTPEQMYDIWMEGDDIRSSTDEEIPLQDGNPKESGVDCSLNQQGKDSMEKEVKDNSEVEDKAKQCSDCNAKKEEVKDDSGVAKKDAEGEAPTEEKKDEGKKEDKKAEDAMIAVADALPEILKGINEIKASLAQKQSATDSAPIMYGLDEEASAYNPKEDKVLKKYLGED